MKHFILANWYKLITAIATLIFACAFFVYSVKNNAAFAADKSDFLHIDNAPNGIWIVANGKGIFEVTWDNAFKKYKCELIFSASGR